MLFKSKRSLATVLSNEVQFHHVFGFVRGVFSIFLFSFWIISRSFTIDDKTEVSLHSFEISGHLLSLGAIVQSPLGLFSETMFYMLTIISLQPMK